MNTKQVFIILVATLFLAVSIVGAQAGTTVKSSKSNSSERVAFPGNQQGVTATTPTTDATTGAGTGHRIKAIRKANEAGDSGAALLEGIHRGQ
jgi:hypothetical protein